MSATENHVMIPASSICGFYLAHPDAKYFAVGKIGDDQLASFAKRAEVSERQARDMLAANLSS
jgi:5-methyltetrahydrofolate--homocysteine methyltransferase